MKWTTTNVKHVSYTRRHDLFVGTHTGSFKGFQSWQDEKAHEQKNFHDVKELNAESKITALAFGNTDCSVILVGHMSNRLEIYRLQENNESIVQKYELKENGTVGLARHENILVAGFVNGKIQLLPVFANTEIEEEQESVENNVFTAGDHMSRLRQCNTQRNLIAIGGKERQNNLKVFDISGDMKKPIFSSKNLPNDYLQLEVPVWDSDIGFIDSPSILATCSRHGYVRVYDTRKQRRPVQIFATEEPTMSFATLTTSGNYIYTGTTMGSLKAFDMRHLKNFVHTYKGFTGAISDLCLDSSGKYLASASLDRYVRIHHVDSTVMLYQCYVKSKATRVLIKDAAESLNTEEGSAESCEKNIETKAKRKSGEDADEEYEQMFENMQTIYDDETERKEKVPSKKRARLNETKQSKNRK